MAKNRRRLSRVKWVFTILAVMLLALEVASGWCTCWTTVHSRIVGANEEWYTIGASQGNLSVSHEVTPKINSPYLPHHFMIWVGPHWEFLPRYEKNSMNPAVVGIMVPFWIPFLPFASFAALAWKRDLRAKRLAASNACPSCGYDRSGLSLDALCPECGKAKAEA